MQTSKIKEVSARVLLTKMPQDGVDQFTFMRPHGSLTPAHVEAALQFTEFLDPINLLKGLNKLMSSYLVNGETDIEPEDVIAIEKTVGYLISRWEIERGTFEPVHETFQIM